MYGLDKIRDNRTEGRARYDYTKAKKNEKLVMEQIIMEDLTYRGVTNTRYEFIDPKESFNDGKFHSSPDVYYFVGDTKYTLEIKFSNTGRFNNNCVYVKPNAIYSMLNHKDIFPKGYLLVSTPSSYAKMKVEIVNRHPLETIDEWSNESVTKKGFVIPIGHFDWKDWSTYVYDRMSDRWYM